MEDQPRESNQEQININDPTQREKFFWYIKQAHQMGVPKEKIIKRFSELGWPIDFIIESLEKLSPYKENIMIAINDLTKVYESEDNSQIVLKNINLEIHEGEFVAITGHSGAGKTSLLNLIGLLDNPTSGKIFVDGNNICDFSERKKVKFRLKTVSYIFQFFNLINNFNVLENIAFQLKIQGYSHRKALAKSMEIIDFLGMKERAYYYPHRLSGGEQQRVAIGRALAKDSSIILADEPTAYLDAKNGQAVMELFKDINKKFGKTIILVTHEQDFANQAGRVVLMSD